ncbi:MAG: DUF5680 domain-containing protein [Candidatus Curtissbacteria bacterium]|nr:DUF5680 domain-containing protein [Candidatus Curtissbacteria bacterium]
MKNISLDELNRFLGEASLKTYAGTGVETKATIKGFKELEYRDGDWYYRDNYTGFFKSWGQEVVWYKDQPVWMSLYGGGLEKEFYGDEAFAIKIFNFLKKALSSGEKSKNFQPRGPKNLSDGDWVYHCQWTGDLSDFKGHEEILYKGRVVFTHDFIGGVVIPRKV